MATVIARAEITEEGVLFHWPESRPNGHGSMTREALESWIEALSKFHQRGYSDLDLVIVNPLEFP